MFAVRDVTTAEHIRRIAELLKALVPEETISYEEIEQAVGKPRAECRYMIQAAKRIASRELGAVFKPVRGVGYRRLHPEELHSVGTEHLQRAGKTCKNGQVKIKNGLRFTNGMSPSAQARASQKLAHLGIVQHMTKQEWQPPLDDVVHKSPGEVVIDSLERMRAALGRT